MAVVLAVTRRGADEGVPHVAESVAKVLHAPVRRVAPGGLPGRPAGTLLGALRTPDVGLVVVGLDAGPAPLWRAVVHETVTPVIVVPPGTGVPGGVISRVLAPLDGTTAAARTVDRALRAFADAGAELVVLVVATASTGPRCLDHLPWDYLMWEEQFRGEFCDHPGARVVLRGGVPGTQIAATAVAERADLIVLGWSRSPASGRAATVRRVVDDATVPVLLIASDEEVDPVRAGASAQYV